MTAAWHGGVTGAEQYVGNPDLAGAISSAMDFWFSRDFTVPGCLDQGGTSACPCGTPGLWNTNWFSNVSYFEFTEPASRYRPRIGHTRSQTCWSELLAV
jgi:hypothetical protein